MGMTDFQEFASDAARRGPLFIFFNLGSGHGDPEEEKQIMRSVFEKSGRAFEFLTRQEAEPIEGLAQRAVQLAQARQGVV
ncbi:MAG: diacylglycerol kinase, partial [Polaromonas sp.]